MKENKSKQVGNLKKPNYWMMLPTIIFLLFITGILTIYLIYLSVTNVNLSIPSKIISFVGFDNFTNALTSGSFWASVKRTGIYLIAIVIQLVLGTILAIFFFLLKENKFLSTLRALMLMSLFVPPVISGVVWRYMLSPKYGVINTFLELNWLSSSKFIMVTVNLIDIWQWTPFIMLLVYAYMSAISPSIMEAADVDGASTMDKIKHIIIPLSLPGIIVALIIRLIFAFRSFDNIWSIAAGGPGNGSQTLPIFAYRESFLNFNISYGAAIGVIMLAILIFISNLFYKYIESNKE